MNPDILRALARQRAGDMQDEAARRRALRAGKRHGAPLRSRLARACRALGNAALTLGDALAEPR